MFIRVREREKERGREPAELLLPFPDSPEISLLFCFSPLKVHVKCMRGRLCSRCDIQTLLLSSRDISGISVRANNLQSR